MRERDDMFYIRESIKWLTIASLANTAAIIAVAVLGVFR